MSAYWLVVPAAGIGRRFQSSTPKQYLSIAGKLVIEWSITQIAQLEEIKGVVVALTAEDPYWKALSLPLSKPLYTVVGGSERSESVLNCLNLLDEMGSGEAWVLVHDAARPCVDLRDVKRLIDFASSTAGGILGIPVRDTIKRVNGYEIETTVDRTNLWMAQTPQMFRCNALRSALNHALANELLVTDEASAMEHLGVTPLMVEGSPDNLKITYNNDLAWAKRILESR